jgi:GAF domain-containing protein
MRATTVRFGDDLWDLLETEASAQGISAAQFVRDATIMRLGVISGRRGDVDAALTLQDLAAGAVAGRMPAGGDSLTRNPARLAALRATHQLDSPTEDAFDRITKLAARVLNAPVALISLVDEDRQFFKSSVGLDEPWHSARQTPLTHSFCRHTLNTRAPLVVEDARAHPLVRDNLAVDQLGVAAYAGIPLTTRDRHVLGTLCVIDHHPRVWTSDQIETLEALSASVLTEMELAAGRQTA